MVPCTLRRENCLAGDLLGKRLNLSFAYSTQTTTVPLGVSTSGAHGPLDSMPPSPMEPNDLFWARETAPRVSDGEVLHGNRKEAKCKEEELSLLERIVTAYPPIMESLFSQLPTPSLISLFHTSTYLRNFLRAYPLAWKTLSFRLPQPAVTLGSPGAETPESRGQQGKQYALDGMLFDIIIPLATTLKNLDLCNTAISGTELVSVVLTPQAQTIQHLSVRGCKNVSIKYQIVPWLQMHLPRDIRRSQRKLALRSLYVYRCRHHRRRPYLPSSLQRRDSDSEPTHDLIELCHILGIWTDTAWCPTPGGRCFRRKDYHNNRAAPGTFEVWVPFDRLWRSSNRIGPTDDSANHKGSDGRLWEDSETGHDGEALGTGSGLGEGKDVPAHLRKSHRTFVDNINCHDCGDPILERCETCSIKMHCMGCRKTLCASCAFDRPLPRRRVRTRNFTSFLAQHQSTPPPFPLNSDASTPSTPIANNRYSRPPHKRPRFWWAPGASRSPNLLAETSAEDCSSDSDDAAAALSSAVGIENAATTPLKLSMNWCCLEPIFSGGGGVAFLGPSLTGLGQDRIRAVPLPKCEEYEDSDFVVPNTLTSNPTNSHFKNLQLYESIMGGTVNIYPFLLQHSQEMQARTCPRSLCRDCYTSFRWRVPCRGCKKPLCKEHDFRALKVRKCGYRDLSVEGEFVQRPPIEPARRLYDQLRIPAYREAKQPALRASERSPHLNEAETEDLSTRQTRHQQSMHAEESDIVDSTSLASTLTMSSATATIGFAPSHTFHDAPAAWSYPLVVDRDSNLVSANGSTVPSIASPQLPHTSPRWPTAPKDHNKRFLHRSNSLSDLCGVANPAHVYSSAGVSGTATPPTLEPRLPLPCHIGHPVQWQGCGAYFCPASRPVGDLRPRCSLPNALRECAECNVYVCEFCVPTSAQSCPCSGCKAVFHCPYCATKPSVLAQCQRAAELRAADDMRRAQEHLRKQRDEQVRMLGHTQREGGLARRMLPFSGYVGHKDSSLQSATGEGSSRNSGVPENLEIIEGIDPSYVVRPLPIPPNDFPRQTGYSIPPSLAASMIANGITTSSPSSSTLAFSGVSVPDTVQLTLPIFDSIDGEAETAGFPAAPAADTLRRHSPRSSTVPAFGNSTSLQQFAANAYLDVNDLNSGNTSRTVSGGSLESLVELTRAESHEREIEDRIDREIAAELRALPPIPVVSDEHI